MERYLFLPTEAEHSHRSGPGHGDTVAIGRGPLALSVRGDHSDRWRGASTGIELNGVRGDDQLREGSVRRKRKASDRAFTRS